MSSFLGGQKAGPCLSHHIILEMGPEVYGMAEQSFVTYRAGLPKCPSAQTIVHWIVDTIEAALVMPTAGPVRPHSTQSASMSVALVQGVSI